MRWSTLSIFLILLVIGCGEGAIKDEAQYDFELRLSNEAQIIINVGDTIHITGEKFDVTIGFRGFDGDWYGTPIAVFSIEGNRITFFTTACLNRQWQVVDCGEADAFLALFPLKRDPEKGTLEIAFGLVQ